MFLSYKNKKSEADIENLISETAKKTEPVKRGSEKGIFISGENFVSMTALLEDFESRIDLIYIDPPFNTSSKFYYSDDYAATVSFSDKDMPAYNDSMAEEEYFEFIRERLYLIKKLLSPCGTLYFHIDCKIGHYIKILLDEIFGPENFINDITRIKSNPKNFSRKAYGNEKDVIYIYSRNPGRNIFNNITEALGSEEIKKAFPKTDKDGRQYTTVPCHAPGETKNGETGGLFRDMYPPKGRHWRCAPEKLEELDRAGLIEWSKNGIPRIKKFADEHKGKKIQDVWRGYKDPQYPVYPTEKNIDMLSLIVKQSSCEGSVIMDCFCGSSSFLLAGIKENRYVIGIDKSEAAMDVIKNKRPELSEIKILNCKNP